MNEKVQDNTSNQLRGEQKSSDFWRSKARPIERRSGWMEAKWVWF